MHDGMTAKVSLNMELMSSCRTLMIATLSSGLIQSFFDLFSFSCNLMLSSLLPTVTVLKEMEMNIIAQYLFK